MKKSVFLLMIVVLLVAMFPALVSAGTGIGPKLIAGQTQEVGGVRVWNDGVYLYIQYWTKQTEPWCLNETHVHVATDPADVPQNRGGPIPGQFEFKTDHDCVKNFTYAIEIRPEWEGMPLFILAHAQMGSRDDPYYEETAWGIKCGDFDTWGFAGANWAAYILYNWE